MTPKEFKRLELIRRALKGRCVWEGNYLLSRKRRWWMTLKCVWSVLWGIVSDGDTYDFVEVAVIDGGSYDTFDGTTHWWTTLGVPYKGSGYAIWEDSDT